MNDSEKLEWAEAILQLYLEAGNDLDNNEDTREIMWQEAENQALALIEGRPKPHFSLNWEGPADKEPGWSRVLKG